MSSIFTGHISWAVYLACVPICVIILHILRQLVHLPSVGTNRSSHPPTVFHILPVIGSTFEFGKNPTGFLLNCQRMYGNVFSFVVLGQKLTAVLGPGGNKFVTGRESAIFNAEDIYGPFTVPVFGKDVAFDVPNEVWREQKRFLAYGLSPSNFRTYTKVIQDEVDDYIKGNLLPIILAEGMDSNAKQWNCLDAYHLISTLNILASTRTLHGSEVRESIRSGSTVVAYYDELDASLGPMSFIFPHFPLPQHRRRDQAQTELSSFYLDIIQHRKQTQTDSASIIHDDETDLIATLLKQRYRDGTPLQDHVIANLMIALLMAGRHTSAATGSWILIYIANNPSIANDLYAEQVSSLGLPDGSFRSISYEDIRGLHLMNAVIRETLRLQPPIHSISRMVREDVVVPFECGKKNFIIPKGQVVTASFAVSQVDNTIWSHATEWDPYRWFGDKSPSGAFALKEENNTDAYLPFGGGGHRCIGEQASLETEEANKRSNILCNSSNFTLIIFRSDRHL
ncbi:cytochrome P450 [Lentinula edodes]|uniref:cytochrome P450 n=1 Tax=Lentinula edodes TaxID=5353 RepID=UPI001E8D349C|nr:cytochrome P450 [Lentinula edodes]KAH7868683.1 cytochrome P450 [Lentinula edodes]